MANAILFYLLIGGFFAVIFVMVGYRKIDAAAVTAKWRVRLMWMPAAILLWPLLTLRWIQARKASAE